MTHFTLPRSVQALHSATPQPHENRVTIPPQKPGKLYRLPRVMDMTGLGKSSIYAGVKSGSFCAPVRLSARAVGWREEDIYKWISERVKVGAA